LKLTELAYTRIESVHKLRKKTFVFIYVAVICTTTGVTEQIRVCVSRYDQSAQKRRQKVFTRGLYVCAGRLDIENLLKSPLIYIVNILIWGPWGFVWRGEAHQSIPVATGLSPPELLISD